jgi:hypothetical protein
VDAELFVQVIEQLKNYDLNELSVNIEMIKDRLTEDYYSFAEIAIEKEMDDLIGES